MPQRIKQILTNLTLSVASVFMTLAMAELSIRVYPLFQQPSLPEVHRLFREYDPLLGWRKIANKTTIIARDEYETTVTTNSKGIRGPEYSYTKAKDDYRILILGDSFAEGYTVRFEDLFSEVLKRRLNKSPGKYYYEVINTGTGAYSTDQELLLFQSEGKKYSPDLTVLMFYENDVLGNTSSHDERGYKPLFKVVHGMLTLTNIPVPRPEVQTVKSEEGVPHDSLFVKTKKWLNQNFLLYRFITRRLKNNHSLRTLVEKVGLAEEGGLYIPEFLEVGKKQPTVEVQKAWRVTEAIMRRLKDEVRSIGSRLLVFYIPHQAAIYDEKWRATIRKYGISDEHWSLHQVGFQLSAICDKNNIDFIDPTKRFQLTADSLDEKSERLYFEQDGHWNVSGHRLAGEILAEYHRSKLESSTEF